MARRKTAPKRDILPDPLFNDLLMAKFISLIMKDGQKSKAQKITYEALDEVLRAVSKDNSLIETIKGEQSGDDENDTSESNEPALKPCFDSIYDSEDARKFAMAAFQRALGNVSPTVEVKSRRVGGSTYQVPVDVRPVRRRALGMRWIIRFARARNEQSMIRRLAAEIVDALQSRGGAYRQRQEVAKTALANAAFSHYRW